MKKLTTSIAIAGLLTPLGTHALGVGEIRLQSYLNQTLRAEIPLVLSRESLEDLRIQLASPRDFATAGLERPTVLTKLRFMPERKADGGFVIRVASTEAIREPYLNFLVELAWPEGRMLKTFTVLLDPPDVLAATRYPEPMNAPVIDGNPERPAFGAPAAAAHQPSLGDGPDYGPVGRNEKLWTIAQRVNPDPSAITTEQVVVALFRYNPDAFSRPSVNALNAGAMLRIPPLTYIQELSPATAREEFYRQQRGRPARWLSDAPTREAAAERMPENPVTSYRAPAPGPQAAASPATLGDTSLKAVEALQHENAEMRKRLAELEKRVADLQVLFAERELLAANGQPQAQLNAGKIKETDTTSRTPRMDPVPPPPALSDALPTPSQLQKERAVTPPDSPPSTQQPIPTVAAPAVTTPTIAAPAPQPGGSTAAGSATRPVATSSYESPLTLWMLGAAGTTIATLVGLLFWQRRRNRGSTVKVSEVPSQVAAGAIADMPASGGDSPRIEPEEVDPVFEADVYASYGRFEQALETIENALHRHPEREAYELKLLELVATQGDSARFQREISRIKAQARFTTADFWGKVYTIEQHLAPIETSLTSPSASTQAPVRDETDQLIDQIKQFSLGVRGEATPPAGVADASEVDIKHMDPAPTEDLNRDIPWVPVDNGIADSPDAAQPGGPTERPLAALDGPDHSIEFASSPENDSKPAEASTLNQEFDDLASESIDSLLKELSALHYERHFQEDHPGNTVTHSGGGNEQAAVAVSGADPSVGENDPSVASDDDMPGDSAPQAPAPDLETKLDLARAYSDMGDYEQAREFLLEVMNHGSASQRTEAEALLASLTHH